MLCLVTGGCGFVGSALVRRLLAEGDEVVVLDNLSRGSLANLGPAQGRITVMTRDVTDDLDRLFASCQPRVIFHLAAVHFIPDCDADPARCLHVNVDGTRAVLDAAAGLSRPAPVVLASSAAVYAPADGPHREDDALGPIDVYGYSKFWAEELSRDFAAHTGAALGIARLFNVYGPGETNPHFIPSVICQLRARQSLRLGNLSSKRDYVFVDDVADALLRLAHHCNDGQSATLNVGSGRAYAGHEVLHSLAALATAPAGSAPGVDPGRLRPVDRPLLLANPALAGELLDWVPETSLLDGLKAAWERPMGVGVTVS
jgi:UDP-glucose 4-epimerase